MENGQAPDTGTLRYLRTLVTILTATMILGFVTIVVLLVIRFPELDRIGLPDAITLPEGAKATAFTQGADWYAVVTANDEILIFSRATGKLRQRIPVMPE